MSPGSWSYYQADNQTDTPILYQQVMCTECPTCEKCGGTQRLTVERGLPGLIVGCDAHTPVAGQEAYWVNGIPSNRAAYEAAYKSFEQKKKPRRKR